MPMRRFAPFRRLRDDEGGSVLVIAAGSMAVLLILGAMAIDTGNWFTHKRQLQNRADAAAFAAGVQYEKDWRTCLGGDTVAAGKISNVARQYAGDPTYNDAANPLQNTQVADQSKLTVNINKTGYSAGAASDGGGPCFLHPANPADTISPNGGLWTDVKVDESSVPLFFGGFGISPPRINAQARIGLSPVGSQNGFSPLALQVPNVVGAQLRLYNVCTSTPTLLGTYTLHKLANQSIAGITLWGNPDANGNNQLVSVPLPTAAGCANDYVNIGTEVRIIGKAAPDGPDINSSCSTLSVAQYGGCWTDTTGRWGPEVRVWKNSGTPLFGNVQLTGGTCGPDPYFSTVASCQTGIAVAVNWGAACTDTNVNHFGVKVNGVSLLPPAGSPNGTWSSANNTAFTEGAAGATAFAATYTATNASCPSSARNASVALHSGFVATDVNSGVVQLVKLTNTANVDPAQGAVSEFDSVQAAAAAGAMVNIYLTVGFQGAFAAGPLLTLRQSSPQENGSINCNNANQGGPESFAEFVSGCTPFYGVNAFTAGTWWSGSPPACPAPNNFPANSIGSPWRCGPAAPGFSPGQIADGIAAHTGNCNANNSGCTGNPSCANQSRYVAGQTPSSTDPRLISIFLVPYGAFNGTSGGSFSVPITDFGRFYVTAWGGSNKSNTDPCADVLTGIQPGQINGHFVDVVPTNGIPDPTQSCDVNQLRACVATLLR
jgi:hypothetical protein